MNPERCDRRTAQRVLALVLAWLMMPHQALAAAASQLAQEPMFTRTTVQPNMMLLFDDSASMQNYSLPRDPSVGSVPTGQVTIPSALPGYPAAKVDSAGEWQLRAPALNPLWYNPAITYKPWQDDDRDTFPPAATGGTGSARVTDVTKLAQWDMRWRLDAAGNRQPVRDWAYRNGTYYETRGTIGSSNVSVTINNPSPGTVTYPAMPGENAARRDLFYSAPPVTSGGQCTRIDPNQCTAWATTRTPIYGTPTCRMVDQQTATYKQSCTTVTQQTPVYKQSCTTTIRKDPIYGPKQCTTTGWNTNTEPPTPIQSCTTPITGYTDTPVTTCTQVVDYYKTEQVQSCQQVLDKYVTTQVQQCDPAPITGYTETQSCSTYACAAYAPTVSSYTAAPARYYRLATTDLSRRNDPSAYVLVDINRSRSRDTSDPANRYAVVDAATGQPAVRSDCQARTWCTFEEESQNYANWYTYYRSRLFAAIAVTSQALSTLKSPLDQMRIGYGRINYWAGMMDPWTGAAIGALPQIDGVDNPGAIVRGVRPFLFVPKQAYNDKGDRKQVFDWLFSLGWTSATPTREAVDAVGRYFSRRDTAGPWGDYPGAGGGRDPDKQASCRRNYLLLPTDGEWTMFDGGPPVQPLLTAAGAAANPLGDAGSTPWNADGVAGPRITGDGRNKNLAPYQYTPGLAPQFSGGSGTAQTGTMSDVTMFYWNHDLRPDLGNTLAPLPGNPAFWQHMSTLIVGYGLQASMNTPATLANVQAGRAISWPNVDQTPTNATGANRVNDVFRAAMNSGGQFYTASDPDQLRQSLMSALGEVQKQNSSGTSMAVDSSWLTDGDLIYMADFTTQQWTGQLRAFKAVDLFNALAGSGQQPEPTWVATIPAESSRNVSTSTARATAVPFQWDRLSVAQQQALSSDAQLGAEMVSWLRGGQSTRLPAGTLRQRQSLLGDIVNSSPQYLRALDQGYQNGPAAGGGGTYRAFVDDRRKNRPPVVLVGANDGLFHGFDAATGAELFAYVPRAVYPNLSLLTRPGYQHRYFVDGPTVLGDAFIGGGWRTVAVGSTGAGGAGLFAIDVNDPKSVGAGKVMWDLTQADEPDLGAVLGAGVVGGTRDGSWVLITGNGYESAGDRAVLLVIDLATGQTLRKIDTGAGSASQRNGLGAVTPVYDRNRNIVAVYGGDKLGNLWKFDLSSDKRADWKVATAGAKALFTATDPRGQPQPIAAAPRVVAHPLGGTAVAFGTGKFFEFEDADSRQIQSFYLVWERPAAGNAAVPKSSLRRLGLTGADVRAVSGGPLDWSIDSGWTIDLAVGGAASGERVLTTASVAGQTTTLTSFSPNASGDPCEGGGSSYFYSFDLFAGAGSGAPGKGTIPSLLTLRLRPVVGDVEKSMTNAALKALIPDRYDTMGAAATKTLKERNACRNLAPSILGDPMSIETGCLPTLPVRVWRQELK